MHPASDAAAPARAGEITTHRTAKLGVTIYRQKFTNRHGDPTFSRGWYYRRQVNHSIERFPLGVKLRAAEKLAEEIAAYLSLPMHTLDMARQRYNPRAVDRVTTISTIGDCIERFQGALGIIGRKGKAISKATFAGYQSFLLTMLRKVEAYRGGRDFESFAGQRDVDYSPWLSLPTSHLTARFVMDFKLASLPGDGEEADEEEVLTAKISADTALRNGRSLFSVQALRYYRECHLRLPDLAEFLAEPDFGAKKYFQLLSPDVIVRVFRDSLELRMSDVDAYRAFVLCMHCGLRAGEAAAFGLDWLRQEDRPMLYVTAKGIFSPKHGHGRKVVLEPWVFALLKQLGPIQEPGAFEHLNEWLRARGIDVGKPTHELRKCWMSHKAKKDGLLAASQQGGHKDPKVTATHYSDNLMSDWLSPLWAAPAEAALQLPQFKASS